MPERPRPPLRTATVDRTERIGRDLVRVVLTGEALADLPELAFTDHYVKLLFGEVTRTYTIRSFDRVTQEMAIDFVVHGDAGLAGPWAARAQPGEEISFRGPGGAWAPDPSADVHLLAGDESAVPAIAAAMEQLPVGARAEVVIEVADAGGELDLPGCPGARITWVRRDETGLGYGHALAAAVRDLEWPRGRVAAFAHGNADMVKDLRRYLFVERGLPRDQVSISGYWRTGQDEGAWQAGKRDFVAAMDAEEAALAKG
ncbi:siderophore-interacting protein [Marihabitans asiaticum]|uniref:NADPH-dependent ferric siderophore reductase n=1 Tax=Marihabitans asiaticum TaxID=415218 RepID=A0A560WF31_9MICO|nr:siderophore-interacting protein [Marihabitans asiaticum]TWD16095.1 NADPH-dependent ferric siderophore reductase [Marihabitans asiaticum]TWD16497.1 NADPH-dependent ferric siderophore reductase [Marihabitans asiaticum]TWD16498.1 NADPH-dependent ferric siderophore reductase [Marihabitans asiaticum]